MTREMEIDAAAWEQITTIIKAARKLCLEADTESEYPEAIRINPEDFEDLAIALVDWDSEGEMQ